MTPAEARRVLGLTPGADDPTALRRAYREAVRAHHPDRPSGDAHRFRRSVLAFELLSVTVDGTVTPAVSTSEPAPVPPDAPDERLDAAVFGVRLDRLMQGLDRVGEVTYLDRSLALVEGVLPYPCGALQVLIVGGTDGSARVVDVINLGGGEAPTADEIHRLLAGDDDTAGLDG